MSAKSWMESVCLQLTLRAGLGGVFCLAAITKLGDVQSFAEAIKGFKVVDADKYEHLIISAAFTMPWVEMIAGVLLIVGLWTRAAAMTIAVLTVLFIGALMHVIFDESISADCSCFGDLSLVCSDKVGWCQVIRDVVLLIPAIYLIWRGGGILAIDHAVRAKQDPNALSSSSRSVDENELRG